MPRIKKSSDNFPRTQKNHIPRNISARALATSPKITNKQRKHFTGAMEIVVEVPRKEPKTEQDVFCRMLKALSLEKLKRRVKQCYRRHSTAHHLLEKLAPGSPFRSALEQESARQVYRMSWVDDEIKSRTKPKAAVEKKAAFAIAPEEVQAMKAAAATVLVYES